jgi:hypothetical protein
LAEDKAERLICRNRLLLVQAAVARATSRKTIARARENIALLRQSQIALADTLFRLRHPYDTSSTSEEVLFCC